MKTRGFEIVSDYENESIQLPTRATNSSAGYDFASCEEVIIEPSESVLIKTGIKAYMPQDEVLKLYVRSSLAAKRRLVLTNGVGIIDADYYNNPSNEGHIMVALMNLSDETQVIQKGERIAQGIFVNYLLADEDTLTNTVRSGGFGSSNK